MAAVSTWEWVGVAVIAVVIGAALAAIAGVAIVVLVERWRER